MEHTVRIRMACPADIPVMSLVLATSWRAAYKGIVNDNFLQSVQDDRWVSPFTQGMETQEADYIVAENTEKNIVGTAVLRKSVVDEFSSDGELVALYVLPNMAGYGIGHLLVAAVEDFLRRKGYTHYILEVLPENERALLFYKKHGFIDTPVTTPTMLGKQELTCRVMRKKL